MKNTIRYIGTGLLVFIWAATCAALWFAPAKEMSEAERRPLAQAPEVSAETLLNGKFMEEFESYTLDQFPLRDTFRQVKSLFHYYGLQQLDNNDIYVTDRFAAKLEYPLNRDSVTHATNRFNRLCEKYLKESGSKVFFTVAPDKGYYLAEEKGYPSMDYEAMFTQLQEQMPWATHIDITDCLSYEDYYRTDTHWRQEKLLPVAEKLANALGVTAPKAEDFTVTKVERPFYGVYYGQAALPMESESIYYLRSGLLDACKVQVEFAANTQVYDMTQLDSKDLYDIFLSGAKSYITIENPNATTDRELVIIRDSFGSSLAPLLVQDYAKVTLIDIRYQTLENLGRFANYSNCDVLFLYSTLVLNNSETIQ